MVRSTEATSLEKRLKFGIVVSILSSIGLLICIIILSLKFNTEFASPNSSTKLQSEICTTQGCIETSNMLLKNMKLDVDPCDDFYEYACGRFVDETIIPDDKASVTAFTTVENTMKDHLRLLINKPIHDTDIKPFKNLKLLNQACMDLNSIERIGDSQIIAKMSDMGGWPVLENKWNEDEWTWEGTIAKIRNYGFTYDVILSFYVFPDLKNNSKTSAMIDQTNLGLDYEYIMKKEEDKFYLAYRDYQVDLAILFGSTMSHGEIKQKMSEALEFEYNLAKISEPREERRDVNKLYNPMSITDLQQKYPKLNWLTYLNSLMPDETKFTPNDIIINASPRFFDELFTLLDKTPKETLANYLMWRVAFSSALHLSKPFRSRRQEYIRFTTGKEIENPRGIQCVDLLLDFFPHALGSLYVRKYFKEESKTKILEMIKNIKEAFKSILHEINWMNSNTKAAAFKKIDNMKEQMAYADELLDDAKLIEFYDNFNIKINPSQFHHTLLKFEIAKTSYYNNKLRKPVDKDDWTLFIVPAIVNAHYSHQKNIMKFPAGILQGAFFNADRPDYMNYGGIGFIVGHEITHGFDDQGSRYDDVGNLKNWWEAGTRAKFDQHAKCIIDQYGQYTEPITQLKINGINTQGENIADNGGIKESYLAYQKWVEKNKPEPKLPGIDLTPNQLFWVSAGQVWCSSYREEVIRAQVLTGVHSPSQFRILGSMRNQPEFAKDFKCGPSTAMNPPNKCSVW